MPDKHNTYLDYKIHLPQKTRKGVFYESDYYSIMYTKYIFAKNS